MSERRGRREDEYKKLSEISSGANVVLDSGSTGTGKMTTTGFTTVVSTHGAVSTETVGSRKAVKFTAPRTAYYRFMLATALSEENGAILSLAATIGLYVNTTTYYTFYPRNYYNTAMLYTFMPPFTGIRVLWLNAGDTVHLAYNIVSGAVSADIATDPFYYEITNISDSRRLEYF